MPHQQLRRHNTSVNCREKNTAYLQQKFYSLDGSNGCFGDGSGDAASQEVLGKGDGLFTHLRVFSRRRPAARSVGSAGGVEMAERKRELNGFKEAERREKRGFLLSLAIGRL